jgi:pimeloyl-ACP methyl ester carboxylesterase
MGDTTGFNESIVELATGKVRLLEGGTGNPLLLLHHDVGSVGWLDAHDGLAKHFTVLAPDMPGYGQSERPSWARHPRDLAIILNQLLDHRGLNNDVTLVGLGFGGWVAAEMATMNQSRLRSLVLAAPMGLQPREGEIMDQMLMAHVDYMKEGFRSDEEFTLRYGEEPDPEVALAWDLNKEMTARIAWKPYMFSHQLAPLLTGVRTSALIVWGRHDKVVPLECGDLFASSLPNARLVVVEDAGHFVEMERPEEFVQLVVEHANKQEAGSTRTR